MITELPLGVSRCVAASVDDRLRSSQHRIQSITDWPRNLGHQLAARWTERLTTILSSINRLAEEALEVTRAMHPTVLVVGQGGLVE
jgi:hypothetical protein